MRRLRTIVRVVWISSGLLFMAWLAVNTRARGVDAAQLTSDAQVDVVVAPERLSFTPVHSGRQTGLILLPGALVEPKAYAPLARAMAESGYPTYILSLPLGMAPSDSHVVALWQRIQTLISDTGSVNQWVLAGHSRGGALAARFVANDPALLAGLILLGTSHPKEAAGDLSDLPAETQWITIEGGNHAQFAYYGRQLGDRSATITRAAQQEATQAAMLSMLHELTAGLDAPKQ